MSKVAPVIVGAVAQAQAALYDCYRCGKGTPAEALEKIDTIMSERTLTQAMYDVGYYFPANNPPRMIFTLARFLDKAVDAADA